MIKLESLEFRSPLSDGDIEFSNGRKVKVSSSVSPVWQRKLRNLWDAVASLSPQIGTAVAANDLVVGPSGAAFIVSGNTQIKAITTTNWSPGSAIVLVFSGAPTVKHNTAGSAGTAKLLLAGSVDLVAAANTVLSLLFDGSVWQETARKVP